MTALFKQILDAIRAAWKPIASWYSRLEPTGKSSTHVLGCGCIVVLLLASTIATLVAVSVGYFDHERIGRRIDTLERLNSLASAGVQDQPLLRPVFEAIVNDAAGSYRRLRLAGWSKTIIPDSWLDSPPISKAHKFLAGSSIFLLFALVGLFGMLRGKDDHYKVFLGALFLATICGGLWILVPAFGSLTWNYSIAAVLQITFLLTLVRTQRTRTK